ncbi:MAG TPA: hypothetical protein VHX60_06970 [Acidobacteriaceae bacterium]|jgi:hypothetical protein|nr:hypothetical protein [Acidobacteriaceae bacterium]
MNITSLAGALWAAGFAEHVLLLLVLVVRQRWRKFPFFTAFIVFNVARTIVLFCAYRFGSSPLYAGLYWSADVADLVLQILVLLEAMRIVLRPAGVWAHDARRRFRLLAGMGVLAAFALAYAAHPHVSGTMHAWIEQGEVFSAALGLVLFIALGSATTFLGLVWEKHIAALATGWAVWVIVNFLVEGAYSYLGSPWHGIDLDMIRIVVYQLVTVYWAIMFWLPEPEKHRLSVKQQDHLAAMQKQVEAEAQFFDSGRRQ